jgi:demethylmenaquinone methyltransferase / 2-methoxy-6-polyprenyl-1,4-benzoquinol methylase
MKEVSSTRRILYVVALPLLMALLIHKLLRVPPPPSDFGSGQMFDVIAPRYDLINRVLALGMDIGWRKELVGVILSSLGEQQHTMILDVATGTADVAILLAQTSKPDTVVVGVDPSHKMLEIGAAKIKQLNLSDRIFLHVSDARHLMTESSSDDTSSPVPKLPSTFKEPHSFDAASMAFGIRNVIPEERGLALCQIHALLKPKAKFVILEFAEPEIEQALTANHGVQKMLDLAMCLGAKFFIRYIVPLVGTIMSGGAHLREYWHLQNSILDFPSPSRFALFLQHNVTCNSDGTGAQPAFSVDEVRHLNFGTVQLYILSTI